MAKPKKIQPQSVESSYSTKVVVTKAGEGIGGRNMWNLHIQRSDGTWENIQWMDVGRAERILGVELPRYAE